ncbi:MAG: hypothetical protein U7123_00330 [Potamolinea sp.]
MVIAKKGVAFALLNCRLFPNISAQMLRPYTNNKQQTTNNKQQTTNNKQQTTNNKQQTTNNKQQTTNDLFGF